MAPRFAVRRQPEAPSRAARPRWELLLERDGALATWALPRGVPLDPHEDRPAVRGGDEPLARLDAGERFDAGTYEPHEWGAGKVEVTLHGERLAGRYGLFPLRAEMWMIHRLDPPSDPRRVPLPQHMPPMLARAETELPADDERWGWEVKWDGVRALLWSDHGHVRIEGRTQRDITARYPELRALGDALGAHELLLDGEIVAFDERGRPSFERLQSRMNAEGDGAIRRAAAAQPVHYVAFDLLHLDGRSLLELPYERRRALLDGLALDGPCWRTPRFQRGGGRALLDATRAQGLEGVVAKRLDARYEPGRRSGAWRKLRNRRRQELLIGGWTAGEGRRAGRVGALLLGVRERPGGPLRYAGRVGSGFAEATLDELERRLAPLRRASSPFASGPVPPAAGFAEPRLLAEVEFSEWTREGLVRQSTFKGLRDDKPSAQVVVEPGAAARDAAAELRTLAPGLPTSGAAADWYAQVAPTLLAHVRDRPLRVEAGVELRAALHRARDPERPTAVVFALAPSPPAGLAACVEVALVLHGLFERLGLASVVKTGGGAGLDVLVPLGRGTATYARTQPFARRLAALLEQRLPELVAARAGRVRAGTVLVDWTGNDARARSLAPHSLIAGPAAAVSAPLAWEELRDAHAAGAADRLAFDPRAALARVAERGDLSAPLLSVRQNLPSV